MAAAMYDSGLYLPLGRGPYRPANLVSGVR